MFSNLKGTILAIILSVIFLAIGAIAIINISGGIKVSNNYITSEIEGIKPEDIEMTGVKMKIGLDLIFLASDFKIKNENIKINAEVFGFKRSFFKQKQASSNILIESGDIEIKLKEGQGVPEGINNLLSLAKNNDTESKNVFNAVSFRFTRLEKEILSIQNFNGNLTATSKNFHLLGKFNINSSNYEVDIQNNGSGSIDFKVNSENISLFASLEKGAGKMMFGINSITKFLSEITPDTINFDLSSFDGKKNTIYFESDITYNEVRKSLNFANSKIQAFGGKEEQIAIENLGNNYYKVSASIEDINLIQTVQSAKVNFIEGKTPLIQFGALMPEINLLLSVQIKEIGIKNDLGVNRIENLFFSGEFGYNQAKLMLDFIYNKKIKFESKGFIENFESENRKGFFRTTINLEDFDLSDFSINENIKLKLGKEENINLSFDYILGSEVAVIDNIAIAVKNGFKLLNNSKIEYNLYNNKNYLAEIYLENLNFEKIKFIQSKAFTNNGADLFRILFDYSKFKQFSALHINCFSCSAGKEAFDLDFKLNASSGKIELEKLEVQGKQIELNIEGLVDIRNPQNNIVNLFININKWEDFKVKNILKISDIFENISTLKPLSFDSFSGLLKIEGKEIKNKFNKISNLSLTLPMTSGVVRASNSEMIINGITNKDFLKLEALLQGSVPSISASLSASGFESLEAIQGILNDDKFEGISGISSIAIGLSTKGFLMTDLIKNASVAIDLKSSALVKDFNIEGIANILLDPNLSFKRIPNSEIAEKIKGIGRYELTSTIKFANMEFAIESAEFKSKNSNSIFVGKVLTTSAPNSIQILGKIALAGADLNSNLKGIMPIYMTSSISNPEAKEISIKFDYSQINKYSEARRVLYK